MPVFASQAELETFAEKFVGERLGALEKDARHALAAPYAPFPAILLTFSTIDLLGALAFGDASKRAPTSQQSADYMQQFMNYTAGQAKLLQDLFRHKLVHLAQPTAVASFQGKFVSWHYWHDDASHHLKLVTLPAPRTLAVASGLTLTVEQEFEVSIGHLVNDVGDSARRPGGYLPRLKTDVTLRGNFEKAISQIYGP
ncbi:MAG TPA: hypothetical protein VJ739_18605 [Gemmataceae bacterium]|nr:hypothetical protein [Gemmataceae bacterium]